METTKTLSDEWVVERYENVDTVDGARFISPNGFSFKLDEPLIDSVRLLAELVRRDNYVRLPDGQTLFFDTQANTLTVLDCDPWINKGFDFKDFVCTPGSMAFAIKSYMELRNDQ